MNLSVRDVASLLQVSEKTVYRWLAAGTLPHSRVGDQYRFAREEIMDWAASSGRPMEPIEREPPLEAIQARAIHEVLRQGGIHYRIGGSTPPEALREIVSLLKLPAGLSETQLLTGLISREAIGSTGIGDGVAVPHPRHPAPQLSESFLALAFLAQPVNWDAVDGAPVRMAFVLCSPSLRAHIRLLSRLTFLLRDRSVQSVLKKEGLREEILSTFREAEARIQSPD